MGLTASGRVAVAFVYIIEFLTPKWRLIFSTISSLTYVLVFFLTVIYLKYISNDYYWICLVGVIMGYISVFGVIFFTDESPLFLL